jgi:hypothetical protein
MRRYASIALTAALALGATAAEAAPSAPTSTNPPLASAIAYAGNRIAVDADGNFNDPDDWAATPATLAILARQELQEKLVHYSYNSSLGATANDPFMYTQMTQGTLLAAERFGFDLSKFHDLQTDLAGGIGNLLQQINQSSATDPLFILAAGPMEFLWRAISGSDPAVRRYVTVISHSAWNNNRVWLPAMTHTAEDLQALGVTWVQISDQNVGFNTKPDWAPWYWLRDAAHLRMQHLYDRMQIAGKPDMSDAGMAFFLMTGDQDGTAEKLRTYFGDWARPLIAPSVVAQAESGIIYRGRVGRDHAGYSGAGFVDFINTVGSYVELNVGSPGQTMATLTFRFANGTDTDRPMEITVNGEIVNSSLGFGPTGSWEAWQNQSFSTLLRAGTNSIRARAISANGGPNLDQLVVSTGAAGARSDPQLHPGSGGRPAHQ